MALIRDFGLGVDGFARAFRFALRHGMGWMFLVPVLLWILLSYGLFSLLDGPLHDLTACLSAFMSIPVDQVAGPGLENAWNAIKGSLEGAREMITLLLLKIAVAYFLYKVNKYLVLILLSPLLAYASERTEQLCTGRSVPFSWGRLVQEAWRGSLVALRNAVIELLLSIGIWSLTLFLPIVAPISLMTLFLISAYFYGFSTFDYVLERRQMGIAETVTAVNARSGAVMANGILFSLLMKIPLFGVMFGPVLASIGAALVMARDGSMDRT